MRLAAATVAALAAVTLAACSSTSNGIPTAPSSSLGTARASSSEAAPIGLPLTSTSTASAGLTTTQAQAALLTLADFDGRVRQTHTDSDAPLPCRQDEQPLSRQFPPDAKAWVAFVGTDGKSMYSEEIETFANADTLDRVIQTIADGLSCESATTAGAPLRIDGPGDLTGQLPVPVDFAEVWTLRSPKLHATLFIAQMEHEFAVFRFSTTPSADTSKQPNAILVLEAGLAKLEASLK